MNRRVLLAAIFILAGSGIFLLVKVISFPRVPRELVMNEEGYYQEMNRLKSHAALTSAARITFGVRHATAEKVIAAATAIISVSELLKDSDRHLAAAMALRSFPDSIKAHLTMVSEDLDRAQAIAAEKKFDLNIIHTRLREIPSMPVELVSLQILKCQNDIQSCYELMVDEFSKELTITRVEFHREELDAWTEKFLK